MQSRASTVEEYLAELPEDRREIISYLRNVVLEHLPTGYEETMNWGMISYEIPLSRYPETYNKQPLGYVALASQKNHCAIYMMGLYTEPDGEGRFREAWAASGKKLDMGKSCIRFKKLDDLDLDLIGQTIASMTPEDYIDYYEKARGIS